MTSKRVTEFRVLIENEILEAGRRGGEAFLRSRYAISEYWLCIEIRLAKLHNLYCKTFALPCPSVMSDFRAHIQAARRNWSCHPSVQGSTYLKPREGH